MLDGSCYIGFWATRQVTDGFVEFVCRCVPIDRVKLLGSILQGVLKDFRTSILDDSVTELPPQA
ncbi:hypothetical protein ASG75_13315 [Rhodanobacter sp. Soil772]|nr:hypothetical protein ASG75_13315 [Rhodanobacter sp. Soil772]